MSKEDNLIHDPEHSRRVGKLGGRPKGSKNFGSRMKELLAGLSSDGDWTSPLAVAKFQIIFAKHKGGEKDGEYLYDEKTRSKAIEDTLDRLEGRPSYSIGLSGSINSGLDTRSAEHIKEIHDSLEYLKKRRECGKD